MQPLRALGLLPTLAERQFTRKSNMHVHWVLPVFRFLCSTSDWRSLARSHLRCC